MSKRRPPLPDAELLNPDFLEEALDRAAYGDYAPLAEVTAAYHRLKGSLANPSLSVSEQREIGEAIHQCSHILEKAGRPLTSAL